MPSLLGLLYIFLTVGKLKNFLFFFTILGMLSKIIKITLLINGYIYISYFKEKQLIIHV